MLSQHLTENQLEQYAMGILPEEQLASSEEHLLICQSCQSKLAEADEFVHVFRAAAMHAPVRAVSFWARVWSRQRLLWSAAAVGLAALVLFLAIPKPGTLAPATVLMQSMRGPEVATRIPAGRPAFLLFQPPAAGAADSYQIEIVNSVGRTLQTGAANWRDGHLAILANRLSRGSYWVRLYDVPQGRELVAEYGLNVE